MSQSVQSVSIPPPISSVLEYDYNWDDDERGPTRVVIMDYKTACNDDNGSIGHEVMKAIAKLDQHQDDIGWNDTEWCNIMYDYPPSDDEEHYKEEDDVPMPTHVPVPPLGSQIKAGLATAGGAGQQHRDSAADPTEYYTELYQGLVKCSSAYT
jgi:hypothetical protein